MRLKISNSENETAARFTTFVITESVQCHGVRLTPSTNVLVGIKKPNNCDQGNAQWRPWEQHLGTKTKSIAPSRAMNHTTQTRKRAHSHLCLAQLTCYQVCGKIPQRTSLNVLLTTLKHKHKINEPTKSALLPKAKKLLTTDYKELESKSAPWIRQLHKTPT